MTLSGETQLWRTLLDDDKNKNIFQDVNEDFEHARKLLCAVSYIIHHQVQPGMIRRLHKHIPQPSNAYHQTVKKVEDITKHWQNQVVTNFVLIKAKKVVEKAKTTGQDLLTVEPLQRKTAIMEEWSEKECVRMWACLTKYIDFRAVFHPEERVSNEMKQFEKWLKYAYYLSMDDAIKLRLMAAKNSPQDARKKDRLAFKNWREVSKNVAMPPRPSLENVPIKLLYSKKETEVVEDYPPPIAFNAEED